MADYSRVAFTSGQDGRQRPRLSVFGLPVCLLVCLSVCLVLSGIIYVRAPEGAEMGLLLVRVPFLFLFLFLLLVFVFEFELALVWAKIRPSPWRQRQQYSVKSLATEERWLPASCSPGGQSASLKKLARHRERGSWIKFQPVAFGRSAAQGGLARDLTWLGGEIFNKPPIEFASLIAGRVLSLAGAPTTRRR